jgi:hypothetical protein
MDSQVRMRVADDNDDGRDLLISQVSQMAATTLVTRSAEPGGLA